MKLTQTQRAVLSSAFENEQGAATPPICLKAWQADKTALALIDKGLVKEIRAKGSMPIWREDEKGRSYALKILKAGREAVAAIVGGDRAAEAKAANCTRDVAPLQSAGRSSTARRSRQNEQSPSSVGADVAA